MKSFFRIASIIIAGLFVIYISLFNLSSGTFVIDNNLNVATLIATQQISENQPKNDIDSISLQDNPELYKNDDPSSVVTIYLTIKGDNHLWQQINNVNTNLESNNLGTPTEIVEVIVQFGDDTGPLPNELGYRALTPNATIETRGATSAFDPQKSYKLTLFDSTGTWRGQSIINLNKHLSDETRFRNKLSFDLMKQIPGMISLRTQFVHLYVKDESSVPAQTAFVDYGLYTQVEQPNKRFLESRLFDKNGQFYKANNFLFNEYPDQIRLATDPLYDINSFSQILEIKGSNDHAKLIEMLQQLNDEEIPIEQIFEKYFDADNYFTWMAFNILTGNVAVDSQNYLLYSPKNGNKWYFIPWDYDKAFPLQTTEFSTKYFFPWQKGVSTYWSVVLHRRVLMVGEYKDMLDSKLDELLDILYPEAIDNLIKLYQPVVDQYSFKLPDIYNMPVDSALSHKIAELLPSDIDNNYNLYVESLETPMPFSLGDPERNNDQLTFVWSESFDLGYRDFSYQFTLGRDWAFNETVYQQDLTNNSIDVPVHLLVPGKYFWRVTAINSLGNIQYAYDYYVDGNSVIHPGVKVFYISPDGDVLK